MGFFPDLLAGKPEVLADPTGRKWYDLIQAGKGDEAALDIIVAVLAGHVPEGADVRCRARAPTRAPGRRRSRRPRSTTSRAASPPSSATSGPRTPAATTCTATSSSATTATRRARSSRSPSIRRSAATTRATCGSGWQAYEKKTGGSVLAIAHNGNLSNGRMFPIIESFPASRSTASTPSSARSGSALYEVTQTKGDGEAHPFLSPNDEFADFETLGQGQPRRQRARRRRTCSSSSTRARR